MRTPRRREQRVSSRGRRERRSEAEPARGVPAGVGRLLFALLVAVGALPAAGWPLAAAWFAAMVVFVAGEQHWLLPPRSPARGLGRPRGLCSWLLSAGYSLAASYLVLFHTGAAQTFGVTLFGVTMFQILVRDYGAPRRLLLNLSPLAACVVLVQLAAAAGLIMHGRPWMLVTLVASPVVVFWAFRALKTDLTRNRRQLAEAAARAEAAVRAIQEAHRIALMAEEVAGVGHWRRDARTGVASWSDGVFRVLGLDPAGGVPSIKGLLAVCAAEDRDRVRAWLTHTLSDGAPSTVETRIVRPDGQIRHVLCNGAGECNAAGEMETAFGVFLDVTEARERELALRASEARYRLLADAAPDMISECDLEGTITYMSAASRRILGMEPEALIGCNVFTLLTHGDDADMRAACRALIKSKGRSEVAAIQFRGQHVDGHEVWLESRPKPVIDPASGEVTGFVDIVRDISAHKALEAELKQSALAAEAAVVAKSDFLANMSHEIRTPLTAIVGFSGLLENVEALPADARLYAKRIVAGGRSLLSVVNDILDFSKLEANQVELDPQPFSPAEFVESALALVAAQAANKGLALEMRLDADLPALVEADSARLRQVLLNLLSNAIKFTARGRVTVTAGYHAADGLLRLAVSDTGPGVPADQLERLFQRFSQLDSSISRRHGGTGLGLAICSNLVTLMGGDIKVESVVGAGSTFSFTIAAPVAERIVSEASERPADEDIPAHPGHILIVDDLAENRELVRTLLRAMGHRTDEASGGAEGVSAAIGARYDLILMDLQMPGMDGLAAAKAIRDTAELNRTTPILALSANVLPDQVAQCLAAGMNDHIAKPIRLEELVAKVTHWIGPLEAAAGEAPPARLMSCPAE